MKNNAQQIGSWNGLILMRETGESSRGAHRHTSHMLRLQTHGVTINEWRNGTESGTAILEPGSLAISSLDAQHAKCSNKRYPSGEEPQQMVALLTDAIVREAADAAFVRGSRISLDEKRKFRDIQLERLLWTLHDEALQNGPANRLFGDMVSSAVAIHLITNHAAGQSAALPFRGGIGRGQLNRVLDYVQTHLDQELSLSALAETASMSQFHFSRAFRQSMGLSPHQYILDQRIERAKSLLRTPELTVGEISLRTGFARQSHFTRVFHKKTRLTPTEFRRDL